MTLRLRRYDEVPPNGFRYKEPETGTWLSGPTWKELTKAVRKHRTANNLPIPLGLDSAIEQQLCEIIPPEWCVGDHGHVAPAHPVTLSEALEGTKVLLDWWRHGKRLERADESERRAVVCMRCHYNQPVGNCTSCSLNKLRQLAAAIVAGSKVPHDHALHVCSVCGCSLSAKVRLPMDLLQRHLSDDQSQRLPAWCWLKRNDNSNSIANNPA